MRLNIVHFNAFFRRDVMHYVFIGLYNPINIFMQNVLKDKKIILGMIVLWRRNASLGEPYVSNGI